MRRLLPAVLAVLALAFVPEVHAAQVTTVSSSVPPGAIFDASANGATVAYLDRGSVHVWRSGRGASTLGPPAVRLVVAVSADGSVVAFDTGGLGHQGTDFYDVRRKTIRFLPGYMLSARPKLHQQLSANGNYALLLKGSEAGPGALYDRATRHAIPLPSGRGLHAEGLAMSPNSEVLLVGEQKAYRGEVATLLYDRRTGKHVKVSGGHDAIHWLSNSGEVSVTMDDRYGAELPWIYSSGAGSGTDPFATALQGGHGFSINDNLYLSTSLSGDGKRLAFACQASMFLYALDTGTYYQVVNNISGGKPLTASERQNDARPIAEIGGMVTADESILVFASVQPGQGSGLPYRPGLFEVATADATPVGAAPPAECGG